MVGYQKGEGTAATSSARRQRRDKYWYWNAGVTLGFLEKWSLDFRYWDTSIENNNLGGGGVNGFCTGGVLQCDQRFVATSKFTF